MATKINGCCCCATAICAEKKKIAADTIRSVVRLVMPNEFALRREKLQKVVAIKALNYEVQVAAIIIGSIIETTKLKDSP